MINQTNVVEKALAFAAIAYQGQDDPLSGIPRIVGISEAVVCMASIDPKDRDMMAAAALKEGLVVITAGGNVLRFVPPFVISKEDIDEMAFKLSKALETCKKIG